LRKVICPLYRKFILFFSLPLLLISKYISEILGGYRFPFLAILMSFILAAHYISSTIGASSDLLFYHFKNTVTQMVIFIVGGITSLVLCCFITRWFGAQGVLFASLVGLSLMVLLHALVFNNRQNIRFEFRWIVTFAILLLLTGGLLERVHINLGDVPLVRWMVASGLVIFASYRFFFISKSFTRITLVDGATP